MIRITIELDKWGQGKKVTHLGTIHIRNTGEREDSSLQNYEVSFLDRRGKLFRRFRLEKWARDSKSVWKMLKEIVSKGIT